MVHVRSSRRSPVLRRFLAFVSFDTIVGCTLGFVVFLSIKAYARTAPDATKASNAAERALLPNDAAVLAVQKSNAAIQHLDTSSADNKNSSNENNDTPPVVVAFCVSVTGCGSDPITEGAAVLAHSIHRSSAHGTLGGRYDYRLYAIYHPNAAACAEPLEELGYTLLKRDTPVAVADIRGDFLREKIEANGCCGEKELIKLEAYTLTEHPLVVHLDLDVLVLKPLDTLFDLMMGRSGGDDNEETVKEAVQWSSRDNAPLPAADQLNAFYTVDYNMVGPQVQYKPVQGGFLVTRPDLNVYEEYKEIVKEGDFRKGQGWGGKVGPFHGSMTFQGIVPYFYNVLHPGQAVELNRCIYNQMCDNPRTGKTVDDVVQGDCRTGEDDCPDCRSVPVNTVVTTHFTLCQKPWSCLPHSQNQIQHRLCRQLTHEWYTVRSEMERSWGRTGRGTGAFDKDEFFGYCQTLGKDGYIPIEQPYGKPTWTDSAADAVAK